MAGRSLRGVTVIPYPDEIGGPTIPAHRGEEEVRVGHEVEPGNGTSVGVRLKRAMDRIAGPEDAYDLPNRMLNAVALGSVLVSLAHFLAVRALRVGSGALPGSAFVVFVGILVLGRRRRNVPLLLWSYVIVNCIVTASSWWLHGIQHGIPLYLVLALASLFPILMTGRSLAVSLLALAVMLGVIGTIEARGPRELPIGEGYLRGPGHIVLGVAILSAGIAFMVWFIMSDYRSAQTRISALNRSLETMNGTLAARNLELESALAEIKTLRGILPLCSYCKKVRDDRGYWDQVDTYITKHSEARVSHGICPDCLREHFPRTYEKMAREGKL